MSVVDRIEAFMKSHPLEGDLHSTAYRLEHCQMCGTDTRKSTYYRYMADDKGVMGYQSVCMDCFYRAEEQER